LFGVIIGKYGGGSDNIGGELTDSIIGALFDGAVEEDAQFHCCCCCQVHVFHAFGFSILFPGK